MRQQLLAHAGSTTRPNATGVGPARARTHVARGVLPAPILLMFGYSFMPRGIRTAAWSGGSRLEHYTRFFDPLYLGILMRTTAWTRSCAP
jgi:ABC-type spermidine/putrescine transport system permease subunit I